MKWINGFLSIGFGASLGWSSIAFAPRPRTAAEVQVTCSNSAADADRINAAIAASEEGDEIASSANVVADVGTPLATDGEQVTVAPGV